MKLEKVYSPIHDLNIQENLQDSPIWKDCYKIEEDFPNKPIWEYSIKFDGLKPIQVTNISRI